MSRSDRPFTIDEDYDHNYATHDSRYGNYLASRDHLFIDYGTGEPTSDPAQFAALAIDIAQSPIMAPAYLISHPRILTVTTARDEDDRLALVVTLATPLPAPIAATIAGQRWQDWDRDWHTEAWYAPGDLNRPAAYATVTVHIPIPLDQLPAPTYRGEGTPDVHTAKAAVRIVRDLANGYLQPLFAALTHPTR